MARSSISANVKAAKAWYQDLPGRTVGEDDKHLAVSKEKTTQTTVAQVSPASA